MTDRPHELVEEGVRTYLRCNCSPGEDLAALAALATRDISAEYPSKTLSGRAAWLAHIKKNLRVLSCCFQFSTVEPVEAKGEALQVREQGEGCTEWTVKVRWNYTARLRRWWCLLCCCMAPVLRKRGLNTYTFRKVANPEAEAKVVGSDLSPAAETVKLCFVKTEIN